MRTVSHNVYTFDELSDKAKEVARDWFREGIGQDSFWSEAVIEDAAHMAEMIGITITSHNVPLLNGKTRAEPQIYWSGFSCQGDGASFVGHYSYRKGSVKAIASEVPIQPDQPHSSSNNELNRIVCELVTVARLLAHQPQTHMDHVWQRSRIKRCQHLLSRLAA